MNQMNTLQLAPGLARGFLTALILAAALQAEIGLADEPRFPIVAYTVAGNTLLSPAAIDAVVAPFVGPQSTFATIEAAREALEKAYLAAGFASVRVLLPEQDVEDGRVQLRVVEAVIGQIAVEGNKFFTSDNIRASVPALREGQRPDLGALDASLRVANENGAKQTHVVFRQSRNEGEIDAVLRVGDDDPVHLALSLDNSGTKGTGMFRSGILVQHNNLFDRDHALSAQVLTSPEHEKDVLIAGVGYHLPLYGLGDAIDLSYGYSNVSSGFITAIGGTVSGSGQMLGIKYHHYLPRWGDWEHKLSLGFDHRAFENKVGTGAAPGSQIPDVTVRPLSLTYGGQWRGEGLELNASLTYAHNLPGGQKGGAADIDLSRKGAESQYQLWRYATSLNAGLPGNWLLRWGLSGQFSRDALVSGEQFGLGGADSVRGFGERAVANDRGTRSSLELVSPDLGARIAEKVRTQVLAFYDWGEVRRNRAQPGETRFESIASSGLGLRLGMDRSLSLRLDYGVVVNGDPVTRAGAGRWHGSLLWMF